MPIEEIIVAVAAAAAAVVCALCIAALIRFTRPRNDAQLRRDAKRLTVLVRRCAASSILFTLLCAALIVLTLT